MDTVMSESDGPSVAEKYVQLRQKLADKHRQTDDVGTAITDVSFNECPTDHVSVTIPWFYVNCDEFSEHKIIDNLYFINYFKMREILTLAADIETGDNDKQVEICSKLVKLLKSKDDSNDVNGVIYKQIKAILSTLQEFGNFQSHLDVDDVFVDVSHETVSFDAIRVYENDPTTGLLSRSEERGFNGLYFYSQVSSENEKNYIRQMTNETELNQMYYILQNFKNSLLFKPNRVCNYTSKLINICILYLVLESHALPVHGKYLSYVETNIISFMIDCIARSRVLGHWKHNPCTKQLISDLIANYNKNNLLVSVCKLDTARERAQFICDQMKQHGNVSHTVSYAEYEKLIKRYVVEINGSCYYNFDKLFLMNLIELPSFMAIIDTASTASSTI